MPVTSEVGSIVGNDDEMERSRRYVPVASGTEVVLGRLVGLDRGDCHVEKIAHAISESIADRATTTMMTSKVVFLCSRKGLKPTVRR